MAADGSVELFWGDGLTRFRLGIKQLLTLEEDLDAGVIEIVEKLRDGRWRLSWARSILRLGLIGAEHGMEASNKLIDRYFDKMEIAPLEHGVFALAVLSAGLAGPKGDELGEPTAGATATEASASSPPRSTVPAPSSGGRPPRSTPAPSGSSQRRSKAGTRRKAGPKAAPSHP